MLRNMKIMGLNKVKLKRMNTCLALKSCSSTCTIHVFQKSLSEKLSSDSEGGTKKIGNTLWCSCGKYKPVVTRVESICCLDKYEIHESYFKGILSFVFEIFLSSNLLASRK